LIESAPTNLHDCVPTVYYSFPKSELFSPPQNFEISVSHGCIATNESNVISRVTAADDVTQLRQQKMTSLSRSVKLGYPTRFTVVISSVQVSSGQNRLVRGAVAERLTAATVCQDDSAQYDTAEIRQPAAGHEKRGQKDPGGKNVKQRIVHLHGVNLSYV